jgi:hypothetical protein
VLARSQSADFSERAFAWWSAPDEWDRVVRLASGRWSPLRPRWGDIPPPAPGQAHGAPAAADEVVSRLGILSWAGVGVILHERAGVDWPRGVGQDGWQLNRQAGGSLAGQSKAEAGNWSATEPGRPSPVAAERRQSSHGRQLCFGSRCGHDCPSRQRNPWPRDLPARLGSTAQSGPDSPGRRARRVALLGHWLAPSGLIRRRTSSRKAIGESSRETSKSQKLGRA